VSGRRDGLTIILTPVQLAAILSGDNVSPAEAAANRLWGGVKVVGGAVELMGAAALLLAPEPTMLTKVGGAALGIHGSDTVSTGFRQVWTGRDERTVTEQAAAAAARSLGASETQSLRIGMAIDIAVPLVVATVASAARIAAVRAGRISLVEHEAAGGHTIAKHVGQAEQQLRARLIAERRIPAASSFRGERGRNGRLGYFASQRRAHTSVGGARSPVPAPSNYL